MKNLKRKILQETNWQYTKYRIFLWKPAETCLGFPKEYAPHDVMPIDLGTSLPLPTYPRFDENEIVVTLSFGRVPALVSIPYNAIRGIDVYDKEILSFIPSTTVYLQEKPAQKKSKLQVIKGGKID